MNNTKVNIYQSYKFLLPILVGGMFILFFSLAFFTIGQQTEQIISDQIKDLSNIFEKINKYSVILNIEEDKAPINFLNVKSFAGSEIGPLNLKYPDKWQGPYLFDNPTIKGKFYQIVKAKNGYYIVPGDGVKINNKIIGKDIIINKDTNIKELIKNGDLSFRGQALAAKIHLSS